MSTRSRPAWQWLLPLLVTCSACDLSWGGSSSESCHDSPGGTTTRTELTVAGEVEIEGRHAGFTTSTARADAGSFHVVIDNRTIRIFDDAPCTTCDPGTDAGDGGVDVGDGGTDLGDGGDTEAGPDADVAPDAGDAGTTWTPPSPGAPRLVAVIHFDSTTLGTYDLAQASVADALTCNSGVMLDDPDGFFCAEGTTIRPADPLALEGSLEVTSLTPAHRFALDARLVARGRLQLTFDEHVITSAYGPSRSCRSY